MIRKVIDFVQTFFKIHSNNTSESLSISNDENKYFNNSSYNCKLELSSVDDTTHHVILIEDDIPIKKVPIQIHFYKGESELYTSKKVLQSSHSWFHVSSKHPFSCLKRLLRHSGCHEIQLLKQKYKRFIQSVTYAPRVKQKPKLRRRILLGSFRRRETICTYYVWVTTSKIMTNATKAKPKTNLCNIRQDESTNVVVHNQLCQVRKPWTLSHEIRCLQNANSRLSKDEIEKLEYIQSQFHQFHHDNIAIVQGFKETLYWSDLRTLEDGAWLNDKVINFYLNIVTLRRRTTSHLKFHIWNTFFYSKLNDHHKTWEYTYRNVQRWTRRMQLNVFELDTIIVPIHEGVHWTMASIDIRRKAITYFDPFYKSNYKCLESLGKWLQDEFADKQGGYLDVNQWIWEYGQGIPEQRNGYDCGVFLCMMADTIGFDEPMNFSQLDMHYFRRRILLEIFEYAL